MMEFLNSLGASPFSTWLRESPSIWAYPAVLTLHTVGLGVLVGANWMVDLRVLGFARALPMSLFERAFPIMAKKELAAYLVSSADRASMQVVS